jgi:hypothetical protein
MSATTATTTSKQQQAFDETLENKYDDVDDFAVSRSGARGGGKGRGTKTNCRGNKDKSVYSTKHVRKVVAALAR